MSGPFKGVLVPVLTPFDYRLSPDSNRFARLCHALLDDGADGLAIFGTTSEANSMTAQERMGLLDDLVAADIPAHCLMPGIGACSFIDTVRLLTQAAERDCAGVLMLPPFFYKGAAATDDGLFDFVSEVLERTSGAAPKIYFYHIPPVAQIGWSPALISRILQAFPERVAGLKDSSGDWTNTTHFIDKFDDFDVFPGSEIFLLDALRRGGAGCITATGNLNAAGIAAVVRSWKTAEADALQQTASAVRKAVEQSGPLIAVLKSYLAYRTGDDSWSFVRPPLRPVSQNTVEELDQALTKLGFVFGAKI